MRLTALLLVLSIPCLAATIHVPADQPTIQAGLDAAVEFDTILVAPGAYYESIEWPETYGLKLIGSGEENTTIDGSGKRTVVSFSSCLGCDSVDSETLLSGFTIQNGYAPQGGGVSTGRNNNPTIEYVTIKDCIAWQANWVYHGGGGGKFYQSSPTLRYVTIQDNVAHGAGGGIHCDHSKPVLENVTIVNNSAPRGGGILCSGELSEMELVNVTMDGNSGEGCNLHVCFSAWVTLESCILWADQVQCIYDHMSRTFPASNTDIYGGYPGECNIYVDPLFCDPDLDDFTLRNDSPCAPNNNDCGVLMGAWPVECSTSTESATWSEVKALY